MKNDTSHQHNSMLWRYALIVGAILLLTLYIVYRLIDNTIIHRADWNALAEKDLSRIEIILPVRGNIVAADGSILATNMTVYTPAIDFRCPKFDENAYRAALPALSDSLARYFTRRTASQWREYLSRPLAKDKKSRSRCFVIVRDISQAEVDLLCTFPFLKEKRRYNGFKVDHRLKRVRPYGEMARRSIGAVGLDTAHNVPFGIYGLERSLDSLLTGTPGYSKKVSLTKAIVDWTDTPATDGYDVLTTIDIKMQDILETELNDVLTACEADWGTAVLIEVGTGDIKAISSLENSPHHPGQYIEALNRAVIRYEPGSVVKLLSLMVAMEDGRISSLDKVYPTGAMYTLHGRTTRDCIHTESLPLRNALEYSSNIVMSRMIMEAYGSYPGRFYTRIKQTGFLEPIHSGIAGEEPPRIDSLGNTAADQVALTRQAYGYTTEISPLYTASLYNAIAGGGRYVRPRLVRGLRKNGVDSIFPVTYIRDRICSETTARELRDMLHLVVRGSHGTARRVVPSDRVEIAGKTGTAKEIGPHGYLDGVNRLSFCGFFPFDNPRYTCMVLIAHPRHTWMSPEATSGRVVKNVAEAMFARGMFGNSSDYTADIDAGSPTPPTYYASATERNARLHAIIGGTSRMKVLPAPPHTSSGIPDVRGLSFRDAVATLERAGYNVAFHGTGYVASQSPAPGSVSRSGQQIMLTLHE